MGVSVMSGYRDDETGFDPMGGEKRKLTRTEWVLAIALIAMGVAMMARGILGDSAPWLKRLGTWPIAAAELLFAWTFLVRARVNGPAERYSPRALRLTALLFVLLAAATIAVDILNSKGAF
jgi:preprotein translocase subunit SecG